MPAGQGTQVPRSRALKFPYENVERRVLGCLPVYRTAKEMKTALRLESSGHTNAEIAKLKANVTNPDDPREGTDEDPRIIGRGLDGEPLEIEPVTSVTATEIFELLATDEFFVQDLIARTIRTGATPEQPSLLMIAEELAKLEARGYASSEQGRYTMTKDGLDAITAPQEEN